jgi:hypothetical protein
LNGINTSSCRRWYNCWPIVCLLFRSYSLNFLCLSTSLRHAILVLLIYGAFPSGFPSTPLLSSVYGPRKSTKRGRVLTTMVDSSNSSVHLATFVIALLLGTATTRHDDSLIITIGLRPVPLCVSSILANLLSARRYFLRSEVGVTVDSFANVIRFVFIKHTHSRFHPQR